MLFRSLTLHNLTARHVQVELDLEGSERLVAILGSRRHHGELPPRTTLELAPYEYAWMRIDGDRR